MQIVFCPDNSAVVPESGGFPALGTRADILNRVSACLPGLSFDPAGRATLRRPGYSLGFSVEGDQEASSLSVTIEGSSAAFIPLRRLAQQTGWQPFDASSLQPIDLANPRLTAATVERNSRSEDSASVVIPWRSALGGFAIAMGLAVWVHVQARSETLPSDDIIRDFRQLEDAESRIAEANLGGFVPIEFLATPGNYPEAVAADMPSKRLLSARFLEAVRGGYRFEFRGIDPMVEDRGSCQFKPAFRTFVYAAAPERGPGRSYAYYSYRWGVVYFRDDGRLPTIDDQLIQLR